MRKCIAFLLLITTSSYASDSLHVKLMADVLQKKDSLSFTCTIPDYVQLKLTNATLNVWIDNRETHKRWKFRYPMIDGQVSASLAISDSIPEGQYAVNFLVQQGFFRLSGEVLDHYRKDTSIFFMMLGQKNRQSYLNAIPVDKNGLFRMKTILFADSAHFVFTPTVKVNRNYLMIKIKTPLDSAFTPVLKETILFTVGNKKDPSQSKTQLPKYIFNQDDELAQGTLPGVTVRTKFKTKVEQYNEEYAHGFFENPEAMIFDGLENADIERSYSIPMFLTGRIPISYFHGSPPAYYLDEIPIHADELFVIPMSEIAMIKVFRSATMLGPGAVAIYTKRGAYAGFKRGYHHFIVKGYTNFESKWQ